MVIKLNTEDMGPLGERKCFDLTLLRGGKQGKMLRQRLKNTLAVPLEQGENFSKICKRWMLPTLMGQMPLHKTDTRLEIRTDLCAQD